jgi:hypothetical protein
MRVFPRLLLQRTMPIQAVCVPIRNPFIFGLQQSRYASR